MGCGMHEAVVTTAAGSTRCGMPSDLRSKEGTLGGRRWGEDAEWFGSDVTVGWVLRMFGWVRRSAFLDRFLLFCILFRRSFMAVAWQHEDFSGEINGRSVSDVFLARGSPKMVSGSTLRSSACPGRPVWNQKAALFGTPQAQGPTTPRPQDLPRGFMDTKEIHLLPLKKRNRHPHRPGDLRFVVLWCFDKWVPETCLQCDVFLFSGS